MHQLTDPTHTNPMDPHTQPIHLTDEQIKSIGITFNSDVAQYVNVT